jgi:hypothetical protein
MATKHKDDEIEVIEVKIIFSTVIVLLWLLFVIFAPKTVFSRGLSYEIATSMAIISDENLILYDYDVYSNEDRFTTGLLEDVKVVKKAFHDRSEVLAVKVYGLSSVIEVKDDYILITSPDTLALNIEYYLVKDLEFSDTNIPCRTFIMLFNDVSRIANTVYLAVFAIISLSVITPVSIDLTRNIIRLNKMKKAIERV